MHKSTETTKFISEFLSEYLDLGSYYSYNSDKLEKQQRAAQFLVKILPVLTKEEVASINLYLKKIEYQSRNDANKEILRFIRTRLPEDIPAFSSNSLAFLFERLSDPFIDSKTADQFVQEFIQLFHIIPESDFPLLKQRLNTWANNAPLWKVNVAQKISDYSNFSNSEITKYIHSIFIAQCPSEETKRYEGEAYKLVRRLHPNDRGNLRVLLTVLINNGPQWKSEIGSRLLHQLLSTSPTVKNPFSVGLIHSTQNIKSINFSSGEFISSIVQYVVLVIMFGIFLILCLWVWFLFLVMQFGS